MENKRKFEMVVGGKSKPIEPDVKTDDGGNDVPPDAVLMERASNGYLVRYFWSVDGTDEMLEEVRVYVDREEMLRDVARSA